MTFLRVVFDCCRAAKPATILASLVVTTMPAFADDAVPIPDFFGATAMNMPFDAPAVPVNASGKVDYAKEQEQLAIYAWQEFIAANWPSSFTSSAPTRGEPDPSKTAVDFAQPSNDGQLVWQTFAHRAEIYPEIDATTQTYPTYPKTFDTVPEYVYSSAGAVPACGAYDSSTKTWATDASNPLSGVSLFNNLDETSQIDLATLFVDGDPADPTVGDAGSQPLSMGLSKQPRRFIYEAKANRAVFDFVNENQFYDQTERLKAQIATYIAVRDNDQGGLSVCPTPDETSGQQIICFPPATSDTVGAMFVKATWRQLTLDEYNSGRYLTAPIVRYRNPDPNSTTDTFCHETIAAEPTATTLPYGLTGLHIIHKTTNYPTFVFATFEQADNLSAPSGSYNNLFYYNRHEQAPIDPNRQNVTSRAHPIPDDVNDITSQVHLQLRQLLAANGLSDSVWLYYNLVGVQGTPVYPEDTIDTDYFLANITTETNEVLRSFSGTLDASNGTIDPNVPNLSQGASHFVMGGCKGCHGNAQVGPAPADGTAQPDPDTLIASDFSFITQNAPFKGVPDAINQPLIASE
ncbi:hypothetical protein [Planktotalea sp.]|uniref:hypothetical protein n=1 Tax=Planktotalea sp. TaxID=2029877 RepID=UPI003297E713